MEHKDDVVYATAATHVANALAAAWLETELMSATDTSQLVARGADDVCAAQTVSCFR
jgi:hypothetical protein